MKLVFLVPALMFANAAFAQSTVETTPVEAEKTKVETQVVTSESVTMPESRVYNLMYLPAKGTFTGVTKFTSTSIESTANYQTREYAKVEEESSEINQGLAYAVSENMLVGAAIGYQIDSTAETKFGIASTSNGTTSKSKSEKGITDPEFLFKYRASHQKDSGRNVDLTVILSPSVGDSKTSNTTTEGNALRGATALAFQTEIGHRDLTSEWAINFGFEYTGEAETEDASNSALKQKNEDYAILNLGLTYQWVINQTFVINLNGELSFVGEREATSGNLKNTIDNTTQLLLGPTFIFNIGSKAALEFGLYGEAVGDYQQIQTNTTTGSKTILDFEEVASGKVTLAATYEF